jgi:hypothetical protein
VRNFALLPAMSIFAPEVPVKAEPVDCEPAVPAPATPVPEDTAPPTPAELPETQERMVDARVKRRRANPEVAIHSDTRRKIMEEMVNCPECGIPLQLRCLAWRHICTPEKDLHEQLLKSALDAFYKRRNAAMAVQGA